jgi:hypothetical protein
MMNDIETTDRIKSIALTLEQWNKIYTQIAKDYPSSVLLIREKTKSVLGFTVRRQQKWSQDIGGSYCEDSIALDFFDAKKKTLFLLRYSDFLTNSGKIDLRNP